MSREETIKRLNEVKAMNLPHMNYNKLKEYCGDIYGFEETEENISLMDEYLSKFLDPRNEQFKNGCWLCDNTYISLSWGLAHGIAYSNCCGLSYVEYHYPEDICKNKKLFPNRITVGLQYHPEGFEIEE